MTTDNEAAGATPSEPTWDELDAIIRNTSTIDIATRAWTAERDLIAAHQRIAGLERDLKIAEMKNRGTLANNLCPDHRDKQQGRPCLACIIETETRKSAAAESRLAAVQAERSKERDAIRLATIEECAGICNDVAMDMNNDSPEMRAALRCETEIRHLKEKA